MPATEFRHHERILVPGQQAIQVESNRAGPQLAGFATVLGMGGMFVRTPDAAPAGTVVQMRLKCAATAIEIDCTVRHVNEQGMGIEFTGITGDNEAKLRHLLLALKP
jgi:hypothetical protein